MTTDNNGSATVSTGTGEGAPITSASVSATHTTATSGDHTGQPTGQTGQAEASPQAAAPQEDAFFDPKSIQDKPELMAAYRQMQKAYTQKTQALAQNRRKVEAYDQFTSSPEAVAQYLSSLGYQVNRAGQVVASQAAPAAGGNPDLRPFEPQTWDDVFTEAERRLISRVQQQMEPVMTNIRETTAKNVERELAEIDPNWRLYEDEMKETLRTHPTLVKNVGQLYRLSVPEDVLRDRAVKEALTKHTQRTQAASVHGAGTTTRTAPAPRKVNSFQDAVEVAKEALRQQGGR